MAQATAVEDQPAQVSHFLLFLASDGADIIIKELLPRLVDNSSAGNLALTCSDAREVCHGSVKLLDLTKVLASLPPLSTLDLERIPDHFPGAVSAKIPVGSNSTDNTAVLHSLSRLPLLAEITLKDTTPLVDDALRALHMATSLQFITSHLLSVDSLYLEVDECWKDPWPMFVWEALALPAATQLTSLSIKMPESRRCCNTEDVRVLDTLQNLQRLELDIPYTASEQQPPLLDYNWLKHLTALTALQGTMELDDLSAISGCTGLRELVSNQAGSNYGNLDLNSTAITPGNWRDLAHLVQLIRLELWNARCVDVSDACTSTFKQLSKLQQVGAACWSWDLLPALAACTQLSAIHGGWQAGTGTHGEAHCKIPSVCNMRLVSGAAPFGSFPNLQHVELCEAIDPAASPNFGRCCSSLLELKAGVGLPPYESDYCPLSLLPDVPLVARLQHIESLTSLQKLTVMHFTPNGIEELAGVIAAAEVLSGHGLQELCLAISYEDVGDTPITDASLMPELARLSGLQALSLKLMDEDQVMLTSEADVRAFVQALSGVEDVLVFTDSSLLRQRLLQAVVDGQGVRMPGLLRVRHVASIGGFP